MNHELVIGWTAPLNIPLVRAANATPATMVGMTAALVLQDIYGRTIDTAGDVTIPDTAVWSVRYTPDAADLVPGVFHMRIRITDSGGGVAYFPSGEADVLVVRAEA